MSLSEFEIIQRYFSKIGLGAENKIGQDIVLGIGDDAAILEVGPSLQQCISTDILLESVHFPPQADPFSVGQRALAVNLSDLAAMGARPLCFTLGISIPDVDEQWLQSFSAGLLSMAEQFNCPLVGGDTSRGPLTIAIQVHGVAHKGEVLRRDGAKVGDLVMVTGSLGKGGVALAALGTPVHFDAGLHQQLNSLNEKIRAALQQYFYSPQPRLAFAGQAAAFIHSAIDISDGLMGDLQHILKRSKVGASIDANLIPYDAAVLESTSIQQRQASALYGGDDYELCITVSPDNLAAITRVAEELKLPLTIIGEIEAQSGLRLSNFDGNQAEPQSRAYQHFSAGPGS